MCKIVRHVQSAVYDSLQQHFESFGTTCCCHASRAGVYANVSPFKEDGAYAIKNFMQPDIEWLLHEAIKEQRGVGDVVIPVEHVSCIAKSIWDLTRGVKGLSGFCLHQLFEPVNLIGSKEQWDRYCSRRLVDDLVSHAVFKRITAVLASVFPAYATERQLQAAGGVQWEHHQLRQQALTTVVHRGSHTITGDKVDALLDLIAEGLLVVNVKRSSQLPHAETQLTRLQEVISSEPSAELEVSLAAPILGFCMLRKLSMAAPSVTRPNSSELDILWLLQQVSSSC